MATKHKSPEVVNSKEQMLLNAVRSMRRWEKTVAERKEKLAEAQKELDELRLRQIPDLMDEMSITNISFKGIGRVTVTGDIQCSVKKEFMADIKQWLIDNGHGDMVTETVNGSTFKAFIRRRLVAGEDVPEDKVSIHQFSRASITKS